MSTLFFPSKIHADTVTYTTSFVDSLVSPDTIATPIVSASAFSGVDPSPGDVISSLLPPSVNLAGDAITYTLTAGLPGVIYLILVEAITSGGLTFSKTGYLAVLGPDPY